MDSLLNNIPDLFVDENFGDNELEQILSIFYFRRKNSLCIERSRFGLLFLSFLHADGYALSVLASSLTSRLLSHHM